MFGEMLENVRKKKPLVHNITNYVTVNDVANAVLAIGASPIMSDEVDEVEEITSICGGLNINIGTLNNDSIVAMKAAGKKANELGRPIVLDPVGAGASTLRTKTALDLLETLKISVVKGNMSEIKSLAKGFGVTKGVDVNADDLVTDEKLPQAVEFAKVFAQRFALIVAITGAIDIISDGEKTYIIRNGRAEMESITGAGCQLSGLVSAYIVANPTRTLEATAASIATMGLAGEIAWENMQEFDGNSTFRNRIIDAIYRMDGVTLDRGAKYEIR